MSHVKVSSLAFVIVLTLSASLSAASKAGARSYVSGNNYLTLDGVKCGFIKSVNGGAITAEVINEPGAPNSFVKKHIGQPKYEAFEMQVGFSMTKKIYECIVASWSMNPPRVNGSVVALDYKLQPQSERQFTGALLTETTIPALDGSSKEPAYMTLKFTPEIIRTVKAAGSKTDYGEFGKNEQKVFLPSSFRLQIDGLDCSRVSKIDSFTVKRTAVTTDVGKGRDYEKTPAKLEFPNLKITLSEANAQSWIDWHERFVIQGNNDEKNEKSGTLTLLAPNGKDELVKIGFFNMGIFRLQPEKTEANAEQIKRIQAELYVERMTFEYAKNVIASGAPEAQGVVPAAVLATAAPTK